MDQIASAADQNLICSSMSIDLSSAFDCVEHAILLEKLKFYNLDTALLHWIESYLSLRSSYVTIGSAISSIRPQPHGVPQGSVLGPLLYLIYVNEFSGILEDDLCKSPPHLPGPKLFGERCPDCGSLTMYADDTQYLVTSNSRMHNQMYIEYTFQRIIDFLDSNGLEVNQSKTTLTEFMTHQKRSKSRGIPPELTVRERLGDLWTNKHIVDTKTPRILGLNLQNNLSWDGHLSSGKKPLLPSIKKQIGILSRLRDCLSMTARKRLMESLVLSRLTYAISIWGNTCHSQLVKTQVCINMAARFVTGDRISTSKATLMSKCDWLDIWELAEFHSLTQVWKATRLNSPSYLNDRIVQLENGILTTSEPRLLLTKEAFLHNSIHRWNNLPMEIRTEYNLPRFKKTLKTWIKDRRSITSDLVPD